MAEMASTSHFDEEDEDECPAAFLCPLDHEEFLDPVIASDGHTYDRRNITEWLESHNTSPVTGEILSDKTLRPNLPLKSQMEAEVP